MSAADPWAEEPASPRGAHDRFSKLAWYESVIRSDLKATDKLVAVALGTYARSLDGRKAFPGRRRLADNLNVSVSTIDRALKTLTESEWTVRISEGRTAPGRDMADEYQLLMPTDQSSPVTSGPLETYTVDQSSPLRDQSSNEADQSSFEADQSSQLCRPIRSSTSGHLHPFIQSQPSASDDAASTESREVRARTRDDDYHVIREDFDAFTDWLENNGVDPFAPATETAAESMWDKGMHPKAILNTLRRMQL